MRAFGRFALCLFSLATICVATHAQTGNATLSGAVTDPSGAAVPGAKVKVTNTATGVAAPTETNSAGLFVVQNLIPGTYVVDVSAKGFEQKQIAGIALAVDQQANINVLLTVGSTNTVVSVTGTGAAALQTVDASIGTVIGSQQVVDLPLNGRSFTQLLVLTPGTVPAIRSDMFGGSNPVTAGDQRNGIPNFDITGTPAGFEEERLDGSENTEREFGGANIPITIDAIAEFKVQTSNFSAQYGRSPVQVDVVTKSGTNSFHGGAYEFVRNDVFDATEWVFSGVGTKNNLKRNEFGAYLGGPIEKNKLFFFFSYEGNRQVFSSPETTTVPSAQMREGIFPSGVEIFDPSTGQQEPNNTIPTSELNPITQKVLNMVLPAPNLPGIQTNNAAGFALDPTSNYFFDPEERITMNQYTGRVDYTLSNKDNVSVRFTDSPLFRFGQGPLATNIQSSLVNAENANLGGMNLAGSWYHNLSPSMVNQFTFAFDSDPQDYAKCCSTTNWAQVLGVSQFLAPNAFIGLPSFRIGSVRLGSGDYRPLQVSEHNYQYVDNVSATHTTHLVQFGADIRRTHLATENNEYSTGRFYFNGAQTRNRAFPTTAATYCPGGTNPTACTAGDSMADFLLGDLSYFENGTPIPLIGKYFSNWAFYVNDTWRVTHKLTVNVGLRYEYQTRWHAEPEQYVMPWVVNGQFMGVVALAQTSNGAITPQFQSQANTITPGVFEGCTQIGLPRNCLVSFKGAFQPRVGFAWKLNDKTVFRGAGGIFYGYYQGDEDTEDGEQYPIILNDATPTFTRPPASGPAPLSINNPLALTSVPTPPLENSTDPYRKLPSIYQWNFAIERQLMADTMLTVAYVASMSRHLEDLSEYCCYYNIPEPTGVALGPTQSQTVAYPQFGPVGLFTNQDTSSYESLQTSVNRRFSNGLQFVVNYTYSQNLLLQHWLSDPAAPGLDRGPYNGDVTNNFLVSPIWNLPFGAGRQWANVKGPLNQIVGGWRITGVMAWRSGFPFTPTLSGTDLLNYNGYNGEDRPNRICNGTLGNRTLNNWFNQNCFTLPVEPTTPGATLLEGTSGVNILRGPSQFSLDTGLSKTFLIREGMGLDFRAEFFNILNHPTFGLPNSSIAASGGNEPADITNPTSLPRIIQFALKLHF